jgi:hypothetical protein
VFLDDQDYTSGEDETDFEVKFCDLTDEEKRLRCEILWHSAYMRAHGGAIILKKFSEIHRNILIFGTTRNIDYDPNQ